MKAAKTKATKRAGKKVTFTIVKRGIGERRQRWGPPFFTPEAKDLPMVPTGVLFLEGSDKSTAQVEVQRVIKGKGKGKLHPVCVHIKPVSGLSTLLHLTKMEDLHVLKIGYAIEPHWDMFVPIAEATAKENGVVL